MVYHIDRLNRTWDDVGDVGLFQRVQQIGLISNFLKNMGTDQHQREITQLLINVNEHYNAYVMARGLRYKFGVEIPFLAMYTIPCMFTFVYDVSQQGEPMH